MEDSDKNAKLSDSAYSNSCNGQSRRSHSSKSTHSESNSSGSSGYCGIPSISGNSNLPPDKRSKDKDPQQNKQVQPEVTEVLVEVEQVTEPVASPEPPINEQNEVDTSSPSSLNVLKKGSEAMDVASPDSNVGQEVVVTSDSLNDDPMNFLTCRSSLISADGFSCVMSMHDGVVMYSTSSLTNTLGFPKNMWIGRSFIDFIHSRDRNTLASQITSGLAVPKIAEDSPVKDESGNSVATIVCRIRRYRGLDSGFGVKERVLTFMPFTLKLTFKNVADNKGGMSVTYLVIQATPLTSAFQEPNEVMTKVTPFVMRHSASGSLEYVDQKSVPYLGYMPQDLVGKDALMLYHPEDLCYMRQVYEVIVKEGGLARSRPYRMITQNREYVKLETEWSSFINPWSKKLEFVIGKHYILKGPHNPDVLQTPGPEKPAKNANEDRTKQQAMRDSILKTMNEVLTKPAELVKQQINKRCQDLASFMESLLDEKPKTADDELRLDIHDTDQSYYDRDSMLGGISPHHEFHDSKSSTESLPSYNQLNYNETLQRFFDSHESFTLDDFKTATGEPALVTNNYSPRSTSNNIQYSGNPCEVNMASRPTGSDDYQTVRLTEAYLAKHNSEMEKELLKLHRETRTFSKLERGKATSENRQKKKEHLARCNAAYYPTTHDRAISPESLDKKGHGVKRSSKSSYDNSIPHKLHCPSSRQARRRHATPESNPTATMCTSVESNHTHPNPTDSMKPYLMGMGILHPPPMVNPVVPPQIPTTSMPGMYPVYYAPAPAMAMPSALDVNYNERMHHHHHPVSPANANPQYPPATMPCMMYGQTMYGQPFMYSPFGPQAYPMQTMMPPGMRYGNTQNLNPLGLMTSNYKQTTEGVISTPSRSVKSKGLGPRSEETIDRTDGESSYSSFYSSFFKTESGSNDDSDAKKSNGRLNSSASEFWNKPSPFDPTPKQSYYTTKQKKAATRRKMEPPWLEKVCFNSELQYKYQISTKPSKEVLESDKQKLKACSQPSLVNEQLGQLYQDLQLEGVAARLTLEEGMTTSSSSEEESSSNIPRAPRKKWEHNKWVMIYEEDAPLPPPDTDEVTTQQCDSPF